jgi:hypothetical protein
MVPPVAWAIMSNARFFSYGLPVPKPLIWQKMMRGFSAFTSS